LVTVIQLLGIVKPETDKLKLKTNNQKLFRKEMQLFYYSVLFLFLIVVVFIFTSIYRGIFLIKSGTPWVPLKEKNIRRLLKLANLNENNIFYDLGSGEGRIVIIAAKEFKIKKAYGVEISLFLHWLAKLKVIFSRLSDKVNLKCENFFKTDLAEADVIICYLLPATLEKLKNKFLKELKPGAKILSFMFPIKGMEPEEVNRLLPDSPPIYVYRI